ncbi:uncharacterized protein B0H64DRAFT_471723 [Chaetomium fimeti]|uniref:RBR-type E3 ubiquitin transferase n=1 Tax=Chaetomium fimeti TaxID=1854472 RepID=A0AAE0HKY1_9PEZI|nr:hypothetical protein B0H64DRAFT_471723 [Chaetomium fimeti]
MPHDSVRVCAPAPSNLIPGHVSDRFTLDGPGGVASTVDRLALVGVTSMARRSMLLTSPLDGRAGLPELKDAEYVREVLGRSDGATESDIEQELVLRAAALRIELPTSRRPSTQDHRIAAGRFLETPPQQHSRAGSAGSDGTTNTVMTSRTTDQTTATPAPPAEASTTRRRRSSTLSFSQYEKYISQVDPALIQSKLPRPTRGEKSERTGGKPVRSGTKKGVRGFTRSIAARLKRRRPSPSLPMPCVCCREDFTTDSNILHALPCGHYYCRDCLTVIIDQSISDESKMPPRCCTQPIPSAIIKMVLTQEKQRLFLKAVVQYNTPWEARTFCPNAACGEFIPPAAEVDPKHPFEALCQACRTQVCLLCKRNAHQLGQDCPEDRDSEAVLKMGETSGWRRCYKCRSLVELAQGCTHITCRCKAQFCYICGAVWDRTVGCPNFCNGDEELERRRVEEEARLAELEAEKLAREKAAEAEEKAKQDAEKRTQESGEFKALRERQEAEMARFNEYEQKVKDALQNRQSSMKIALGDKFADLMLKMRERHAKTEQHLEDRQVLAEIELQAGLEEKEKRVQIKLRHMEDYCNGKAGLVAPPDEQPPPPPSESQPEPQSQPQSESQPPPQEQQEQPADPQPQPQNPPPTTTTTTTMPHRLVTPRDLEQLRQQYTLRDSLTRRHRSQIHGLREKQARRMEELVARHEREVDLLAARRASDLVALVVQSANDEDALLRVCAARKGRLGRRWRMEVEVLRAELERRDGVRYAEGGVPVWVGGEEDDGGDGMLLGDGGCLGGEGWGVHHDARLLGGDARSVVV